MELDKKVVAAIGTAVTAYIEAEASEKAGRARPAYRPSRLWSQAGRSEIMRNRQMWQLRIVPR